MIKNEAKKRRVIIHFMQPHAPYKDAPVTDELREILDLTLNAFPLKRRKIRLFNFRKCVGKFIDKSETLSKTLRLVRWEIKKLMKMKPIDMHEFYWRNYSVKEIKKLYEGNLIWVLKEVKRIAKLCKKLKLHLVVTSDHGEALGENGYFFHYPENRRNPVVRVVPFASFY